MNGLALIASVHIQVVVASRNRPLRSAPSGASAQASVVHAASISSTAMPAPATAKRSARRSSFHDSLVSV